MSSRGTRFDSSGIRFISNFQPLGLRALLHLEGTLIGLERDPLRLSGDLFELNRIPFEPELPLVGVEGVPIELLEAPSGSNQPKFQFKQPLSQSKKTLLRLARCFPE